MVSVIFLILINHFNNIIYICSVELICTLVKLYHNIHLYHCLQLTGTRDQHWNRLTLWNLKKVLRDTQPRPMCENIRKTFVAEPPASSTAMHSRKLPAAIPEFGMVGWLCQVVTCFGHFGLWHVLVTTALVPICFYWRVVCLTNMAKVEKEKQLWQKHNVLWLWPQACSSSCQSVFVKKIMKKYSLFVSLRIWHNASFEPCLQKPAHKER